MVGRAGGWAGPASCASLAKALPTYAVGAPACPSPKQREEDEKAQHAIDLARDEKDEKKDAVVAEHASQSNAVVHGLEQVTERVIDDPDATNDMLNSVKLFIHDD